MKKHNKCNDEKFKDRSVDFFGTEYDIKYVDEIKNSDGENTLEGLCDFEKHLISVKTLNSDKTSKIDSEIELTLYHELVHAMLATGQYISQCDDEPLVEWLARCIFALKKQGIL